MEDSEDGGTDDKGGRKEKVPTKVTTGWETAPTEKKTTTSPEEKKTILMIDSFIRDIPSFKDEPDEDPGPFIKFFESAITDIMYLGLSDDKGLIERVILRKAVKSIPEASRAGAWLA